MTTSRRQFLTSASAAGISLLSQPLYAQTASPGAAKSALPALSAAQSGLPLPPPLPRHSVPAVSTVNGMVSADSLGTTLMHEHVLFGATPEHLRDVSVDLAVKWLNDAKRVGIDTVVDLTPSRDIGLFSQIAKRTPVRIIAATGRYLYKTQTKEVQEMSEAALEARMMQEATEGIDGTSICAGIIKVATNDHVLSAWDEKVFRCAARVNRATGVPIATHAIRSAGMQFDFLVKHGANPQQTFFSHVEAEFGWQGRSKEVMADYFLRIAREGGSLLFNNFGYDFHTPWADLVYLIRTLCDKGYASAVMISIDAHWFWKDNKAIVAWGEDHPEVKNRPYAYMMTDVVPALLKAGFSKREIDGFLIDNPRNYFGRRQIG